MPSKIIFITGTDTGVGKTLLTGLLLAHLRQAGVHALALKPFCCGPRRDVQLLQALQDDALLADEINPFYFREPIAPFVAARLHRRSIPLAKTLDHIQMATRRCDCLLIEGIGGVSVPLGSLAGRGVPTAPPNAEETKAAPWSSRAGPGIYTVLDLITNLDCETIVVSRNQLGTINHTLLTVSALRHNLHETYSVPHANSALHTTRPALPKVLLMNSRRPDPSSASNPRILTELIAPTRLFLLPFLGRNCHTAAAIKANARKFHKILAQLLA